LRSAIDTRRKRECRENLGEEENEPLSLSIYTGGDLVFARE
jgi:hypothetical protein